MNKKIEEEENKPPKNMLDIKCLLDQARSRIEERKMDFYKICSKNFKDNKKELR